VVLAGLLLSDEAWAQHGRFGLGLGVKEVGGVLLVARVLPGSAAEDAGFLPGERLVALDGSRLAGLRDLEARLETHSGGDRLRLDHAPVRDPHRIGAMAIGAALTGQSNTESGWIGGFYTHELNDWVSWVIAGGYAAVGARPFYGRNVFVPGVGLEFTVPITKGLSGLARGFAGVDLPVGEGVVPGMWPLEPVTLSTHLGARYFFLEAFLSVGLGPARGANVGLGVAISLGFGGPSLDDPGEVDLL
jgi:hypothetical protein